MLVNEKIKYVIIIIVLQLNPKNIEFIYLFVIPQIIHRTFEEIVWLQTVEHIMIGIPFLIFFLLF